MASYVPYHGKKRDRLRRKQADLQRLVERGAPHEQLLKAAAEVRDSLVRALRASRSRIPERTAEERELFLRFGERIQRLQAQPVEDVLASFLRESGKSQQHP